MSMKEQQQRKQQKPKQERCWKQRQKQRRKDVGKKPSKVNEENRLKAQDNKEKEKAMTTLLTQQSR